MTDMKKTLKGLECLISNEVPCEGCYYMGSGYCLRNIAKDAMELLKEQEAIIEQYRRADGFLAAHGWKWEDR